MLEPSLSVGSFSLVGSRGDVLTLAGRFPPVRFPRRVVFDEREACAKGLWFPGRPAVTGRAALMNISNYLEGGSGVPFLFYSSE